MLLPMLLTFIAAVCITGLLGLGSLLIWKGLCGKIVDGHPLCGNCKFDLVGHSPRPDLCPECGVAIARIGGIQIGHREQQIHKIVHGSTLMAVNLSIVGLCWWSAERPATANNIAIVPSFRMAPMPLAVPVAMQNTINTNAADISFALIDVSAPTLKLNVESMFSRNLIVLGDFNSPENHITSDQLLLLDENSKLNLPTQPASGVIESYINQGISGKPFRSLRLIQQ